MKLIKVKCVDYSEDLVSWSNKIQNGLKKSSHMTVQVSKYDKDFSKKIIALKNFGFHKEKEIPGNNFSDPFIQFSWDK